MSQINLNKLSEEEILELIKDELSEDELMDAEDYQLCSEAISVNFNKCSCSNLHCSDCLFGKEKRSYVLEKLNINQEGLDLSDYSDDNIVEKLKTIYKYDNLNDLENDPYSFCQIKGNPFYACDCSGISCSDCILDISNRLDLIKLLKNSKPKEIMEDKPSDAIELMVIRRVHHGLDSTINVDWPIGHRTWATSSYKNAFTKDKIIHPENNRYRMNAPATCFAPTNYSDFEGPFKIGDWVEITKSDFNWSVNMDNFVGKKVQITEVFKNGWSIQFKGYGGFSWNYDQGHFIPSDPPEDLPYSSTKKYYIKELEINKKLVIYIDTLEEFNKIKKYTERLIPNYQGKHCYSLYGLSYCSDSSRTSLGSYGESNTILTIDNLILPEIKEEEENTFSCRLSELETRDDIVVFLETKEEYNQLKLYTTKLVSNYQGAYCYSLRLRGWSSYSNKTFPGSYRNAKIVLFKNVILPLSDKVVYVEPSLAKKSTFGQEEIYIIPLPE